MLIPWWFWETFIIICLLILPWTEVPTYNRGSSLHRNPKTPSLYQNRRPLGAWWPQPNPASASLKLSPKVWRSSHFSPAWSPSKALQITAYKRPFSAYAGAARRGILAKACGGRDLYWRHPGSARRSQCHRTLDDAQAQLPERGCPS